VRAGAVNILEHMDGTSVSFAGMVLHHVALLDCHWQLLNDFFTVATAGARAGAAVNTIHAHVLHEGLLEYVMSGLVVHHIAFVDCPGQLPTDCNDSFLDSCYCWFDPASYLEDPHPFLGFRVRV
jgi:hypothetical protein